MVQHQLHDRAGIRIRHRHPCHMGDLVSLVLPQPCGRKQRNEQLRPLGNRLEFLALNHQEGKQRLLVRVTGFSLEDRLGFSQCGRHLVGEHQRLNVGNAELHQGGAILTEDRFQQLIALHIRPVGEHVRPGSFALSGVFPLRQIIAISNDGLRRLARIGRCLCTLEQKFGRRIGGLLQQTRRQAGRGDRLECVAGGSHRLLQLRRGETLAGQRTGLLQRRKGLGIVTRIRKRLRLGERLGRSQRVLRHGAPCQARHSDGHRQGNFSDRCEISFCYTNHKIHLSLSVLVLVFLRRVRFTLGATLYCRRKRRLSIGRSDLYLSTGSRYHFPWAERFEIASRSSTGAAGW